MEKKVKLDFESEFEKYKDRYNRIVYTLCDNEGKIKQVRGLETFPNRVFRGLREDIAACESVKGDLTPEEERFARFAMKNIESKLSALEELLDVNVGRNQESQ